MTVRKTIDSDFLSFEEWMREQKGVDYQAAWFDLWNTFATIHNEKSIKSNTYTSADMMHRMWVLFHKNRNAHAN